MTEELEQLYRQKSIQPDVEMSDLQETEAYKMELREIKAQLGSQNTKSFEELAEEQLFGRVLPKTQRGAQMSYDHISKED